eukprot:scaffold64146_cov60-Phaeocystis_antarctica.AAC.1
MWHCVLTAYCSLLTTALMRRAGRPCGLPRVLRHGKVGGLTRTLSRTRALTGTRARARTRTRTRTP